MNRLTTALSFVVAAAACGRTDERAATTPAASAEQEPVAAPDANVVRIDETMLRDLRMTTAAVESRPNREDVVLLGELAVDERTYAEVGAPVPARAVRVVVALGAVVKQGDLLVELQSVELSRARADLASGEARVALADAAVTRKRGLAAERIVPLRRVQEAEAELAGAQAAVRGARAALAAFGVSSPGGSQLDSTDSSRFGLRAPVSGTVIERSVLNGQMLDPASPAYKIADLSTLWLTVHAFERDAVRIPRAAPATVTFPALPGQTFQGTVALAGGAVAKDSRTVPVRIDIRNRNGLLKPGMSATAAVPVGTTDALMLTVPVAAVQRVRNEWCVFIPKDKTGYEIRKIGRGRDLDTEVEVLSGLKAGETIVVEGAFLLKSQAEKGAGGHDGHGGRQ